MPDEAMTEQVEALLRVEHFDEAARQRIAELGDEALAVLQSCVSGSRRGEAGFIRSRAILALAHWPDHDDALASLDDVYADSDVDDRMRAAMALGEMGTDAAVDRLAAIADAADEDLEQASVVRALRACEAPTAAEALASLESKALGPAARAAFEEPTEA